MFLSPFVFQKVCILQHSSDSVQKPVGPNNDVQKYYTITVSEVLPGCVASKFCFYYYALFIYLFYYYWSDLCLLADDGEQVLVDVEGKDHKQISQHVKKILGKSE